ncbi:MAG: hypothetical protein AAGG69_02175 [Pseudomonadota bacterium]
MNVTRRPAMQQMASGRLVDIAHLHTTDVDFRGDVAPQLARICRFNGAVNGAPYSVAQHCTLMAQHALDEYGDVYLAACCLLHDAHEAYCGDDTRPKMSALDIIAKELLPALPGPSQFIAQLKNRLDKAIFSAARIPLPTPETAGIVKRIDASILESERRQLLAKPSEPWPGMGSVEPLRLIGAIKSWPPAVAETEWLDLLGVLCPRAIEAKPANGV